MSGVRASLEERRGRSRPVRPAQNPHRPARCSLRPGTSSTLTRSGASRRCRRARFRLRRWPAAGVAWRRRSAGRRPPISSLWQRTSLPSSRSPRRCRRGPTDRGPGLGELLSDGALQLDGTDGSGRLCDLTLSSRTAAQRLVDALATGGLIPGARVAVVALAVAGATPGGSIVVVVVVGVGRGAVVVETEPLHAMLVSSPTSAMGVLHGLWTALYSRLNDGAVPDHPRRGAGSRLAPARRRGLGSATTRSAHPFSPPVQRTRSAPLDSGASGAGELFGL